MAKTAAKTKPGTNVAKHKPDGDLMVTDQKPDYVSTGTQRGSENVDTSDVVIPRLELIQALSPAVKRGDPGYLPDARPGMFMNSVTKELYGEDATVVGVFFMKQWLVWKQRKWTDEKTNKEVTSEGGFFGAFNSMAEAKARADQEGGAANHIEIMETPQHLCLLINYTTGEIEEVMVSMPRTKAKISRQWNSLVRLAGGDRFSRVYKVTAQLEKKTQGDYYNFAIEQSGYPAKALFQRAEKLYTSIAAGSRKVAMDVSGFETETAAASFDNADM